MALRRSLHISFEQDLFQIPVAERVAQGPVHTQPNDVGLKMTPRERLLSVFAHEGSFFRVFLPTAAESACYLQYSPVI
ncbi:MAG: hypothetical protein J2P37_13060 [Ktedonobacteraceae bacterium]|nr:hypothetical protein [Ktedonobacteraceae bacterium]